MTKNYDNNDKSALYNNMATTTMRTMTTDNDNKRQNNKSTANKTRMTEGLNY